MSVRSYGTGTSNCFTEVYIDRRTGGRLDTLQLTGSWDVESLKIKSFLVTA